MSCRRRKRRMRRRILFGAAVLWCLNPKVRQKWAPIDARRSTRRARRRRARRRGRCARTVAAAAALGAAVHRCLRDRDRDRDRRRTKSCRRDRDRADRGRSPVSVHRAPTMESVSVPWRGPASRRQPSNSDAAADAPRLPVGRRR